LKLRIQGNSVRLRLRQQEVRQLIAEGRVEQTTAFGPTGAQFKYALETSSSSTNVRATFTDSRLVVTIPKQLARDWADSDQVGIETTQPADDPGLRLTILVEKDFKCLHGGAGESQEGAYPNPAEECASRQV
jgi:hypothetical protein